LILALCAIAGILLGVTWRLRAYLYTGFASLFLVIVANLTRFGLRDRLTGGLLGLGSGLVLLAIGVQVARHKQSLLARYQRIRDWRW
jgi:hypothetical protein